MNHLHEHMEKTFKKCLSISKKKNADYTGATESAGDPFANFRRSEVVGVEVEQGILVRLMDKVSRISNLLEAEAQVEDEKIQDTIEDAINYLAILLAYIEEGNKKQFEPLCDEDWEEVYGKPEYDNWETAVDFEGMPLEEAVEKAEDY